MPHIEIHKDGYVNLHDELLPTMRVNLLAMTRRWWEKAVIYSPNGQLYRPHPTNTGHEWSSLGLRILANTVYNPRRDVPMEYRPVRTYTIDELKKDIERCVLADEDILTQFMEPQEIIDKLNQAKTYEQVIALVTEILNEDKTH